MKKALLFILAGVAIGVLVAPDKGSETWKKITDGLDDVKKKANDSIHDLLESGKNIADKGKDGITTAAKEW